MTTELDKTPLTKEDFDYVDTSDLREESMVSPTVRIRVIQSDRLLGVVEGLREDICQCSVHPNIIEKCLYCEIVDRFFGVLK